MMTNKKDVRLSYKRETGRTPTGNYRVLNSSDPIYTLDGELNQYLAYLEEKVITLTNENDGLRK